MKALEAHQVYLLLLQLAALLLVARAGAELARRINLPAVVGELAAGIVLGPTVFGHYAPDSFAWLFPNDVEQFHLLDIFGSLGMVLLLLLTGLETDLRLLKNLGRAAVIASVMGMAVPFAMGFGLGWILPAEYQGGQGRMLFSVFLATAMSISAMPVIAKILMDLDLTKRNIGLVILSAGVVDDTTGWIILSVIAGVAHRGNVSPDRLLLTVASLGMFVAGAVLVLYPLARVLVRVAARFRTPDTDLVLILVLAFVSAALTERIGVHAVFGAFACGTVLRQVPRLNQDTVKKLESLVFSVLAPIFFGIVGLKVNLWELHGGGWLGVVVLVACMGKLIGCTLGGLWGGMRPLEALAIAIAMNARGAMELVVATIGLSLGILNPPMFSMIVVVAIVTSFMAPIGLKLIMPRVRMTADEEKRILAAQSKGAFDPAVVRMLVPTAGGTNALGAARLAFAIAHRSESAITALYIDAQSTWWQRIARGLRRDATAGRGIEEHFTAMRGMADGARAPELRKVASTDVAQAILDEAAKGYTVVMLGASHGGEVLGGAVLEEVVERAPCHVAIVKTPHTDKAYQNILVPIDGSVMSRVAVEFAVRYAEVSGARLTLAMITERLPQVAAYSDDDGSAERRTPEGELDRISNVFRASDVKPTILHLDYDPSTSALTSAVETGEYDMVVLGAENRAIQHRLYFGYDNERLIRTSPVAVVIVVPLLSALTANVVPLRAATSGGVPAAR